MSSRSLIWPVRRMSRRTRGVEFQRVAAGRGLGIAVHHADLHPQLVDEDDGAARAADRSGQLAQRLAHQPRLEADMAVAHLALDLGPRHQRRDRVDHQHVDRVGAHQRVDDLERLLAGVGLRHDQLVDVDARASWHRPGRAHARRRRRRRCRRSSALRRWRAARAWSCPSFPARRSRSPGRAEARRRRARYRARASRSRWCRSPSPRGCRASSPSPCRTPGRSARAPPSSAFCLSILPQPKPIPTTLSCAAMALVPSSIGVAPIWLPSMRGAEPRLVEEPVYMLCSGEQ